MGVPMGERESGRPEPSSPEPSSSGQPPSGQSPPALRRSLSLPLITLYGVGTIIGGGIYALLGKVAGESGMAAYSALQRQEFGAEKSGYTATKHQREVGTGYFDEVRNVITAGNASTAALAESTEAEQF